MLRASRGQQESTTPPEAGLFLLRFVLSGQKSDDLIVPGSICDRDGNFSFAKVNESIIDCSLKRFVPSMSFVHVSVVNVVNVTWSINDQLKMFRSFLNDPTVVPARQIRYLHGYVSFPVLC